jgi:hypothetical protein
MRTLAETEHIRISRRVVWRLEKHGTSWTDGLADVHPLLGLTSPAPKRRLASEFCQIGNWVPKKDRNGAPFALPARCRPQSPLMAPHLNCRSGCLRHSTLRVEGLEVHVKVDTDAAPDVLSEWLGKVEA